MNFKRSFSAVLAALCVFGTVPFSLSAAEGTASNVHNINFMNVQYLAASNAN